MRVVISLILPFGKGLNRSGQISLGRSPRNFKGSQLFHSQQCSPFSPSPCENHEVSEKDPEKIALQSNGAGKSFRSTLRSNCLLAEKIENKEEVI